MLLKLENISKTFTAHGSTIKAVNGVSLSLAVGESLALVGGSGCGKTTLARIIMGLEKPDTGSILLNGRPLGRDQKEQRDFCRKVRMVFQDPFASLDPRYTVRHILAEALCLEPRRTRVEEERLMKQVLSQVLLAQDILRRYPHEFSGGERQRIAIARALMTAPLLIILDEAVSSLDVLVQQEILALLAALSQKNGVTYLFISHNLRAAQMLCSKIAVMQDGRLVECEPTARIMAAPGHEYTKALVSAALTYRVRDKEQDEHNIL
ncbi:MAG: ABC transporter ATP-binding protein [Candidatus Omnitrophica bacterium]|nr:ABC transporter ATP-binding protein [Candidatus Omnitrophota bacterium]